MSGRSQRFLCITSTFGVNCLAQGHNTTEVLVVCDKIILKLASPVTSESRENMSSGFQTKSDTNRAVCKVREDG